MRRPRNPKTNGGIEAMTNRIISSGLAFCFSRGGWQAQGPTAGQSAILPRYLQTKQICKPTAWYGLFVDDTGQHKRLKKVNQNKPY
jgi:hypothetical protein